MKIKDHTKRKHAKFAPSSSDRWLECAGSVKLSENAPPKIDGPWAAEGTRAHECLEFIVRRYGNLPAAKAAALKKWPEEMVGHALNAADIIMDLKPTKYAELLIESRARLSDEVYGSLDYAWVAEWSRLIVIDYKYGSGIPVLPEEDGEENPQLMCYAAAIAKKFNYEFDSVTLAIIQPRVWKDDENPLSEYTTTIKRIREFEKKAALAVKAANAPGAPLKAGDHCKWCPAAPICPEISKVQLSAAGIAFDIEDGGADANALPKVEALSAANMGAMLRAADLLGVWIAQVKAHALRLAAEGHKIEGRKLVAKRTTRKWSPLAEKEAMKLFGAKAFKEVFLSPAQLEKALGKSAKSFTKRFTSNESSGYSLVKSSDKRPEVEHVTGFDFEAFAEDSLN